LGAVSAESIPAHQVVFDERTINKCQYGCPAYGRYLTCPPHTPPPAEFEKALRKYRWAILVERDPPGEQCRDPLNARPSMSGLGINVFATLEKAGLDSSSERS
jgi:predicted metal-binding protein